MKTIAVPSAADIMNSARQAELEADWFNMLSHPLPARPPLEPFLEELPVLFGWLDGTIVFEELPPPQFAVDEDDSWSPPPTIWTWGAGVSLETVHFAAANHLLIDLAYDGRRRLIEPYSLRRTSTGHYVLHAERADNSGHRSYRVDKTQGLAVTTTPFRPRAPIEFSARGPMRAPLQSRRVSGYSASRTTRAPSRHIGLVYLYQCRRCGRTFEHSKRNTTLRVHQDSYGGRCPGRSGVFVGSQ